MPICIYMVLPVTSRMLAKWLLKVIYVYSHSYIIRYSAFLASVAES